MGQIVNVEMLAFRSEMGENFCCEFGISNGMLMENNGMKRKIGVNHVFVVMVEESNETKR